MTSPRFVQCKCGHARNAHPEQYEEACAVPNCVCEEYIPATLTRLEDQPLIVESGPVARPAARIDDDEDENNGIVWLLAQAKKSSAKRTVALAERIESQITELRGRLDADAARTAAQRRVAELERQLAAARAALRGDTAAATAEPTVASVPCTRDGCERVFASKQARAMHERRAHDGFDPRAARGAA